MTYASQNVKSYKPNEEEHWHIRWHKDSPCSSCKTFRCPELNPFCSKYQKFLDEQLALEKAREKVEKEIYKKAEKLHDLKDEKNVKRKTAKRNNRNNKSDRRN